MPTRWLEDGDSVSVGDQSFEVYHCPGHTPGHVVFFHRARQVAFENWARPKKQPK